MVGVPVKIHIQEDETVGGASVASLGTAAVFQHRVRFNLLEIDQDKAVVCKVNLGLLDSKVYVIDYIRTRFVRALAVTICAILAIKYFARIDACCARIVNVISCIVSIFSRIVRQNLADKNFGRSLSHWRPFLVLFLYHNGPIGIFEKYVRRWGSLFAH